MNVLILMGSARQNGNTNALCEAFAKGAEASGHKTQTMILKHLDINHCMGCGACQKNGGQCVQKDDMETIYEKVLEADVIVFGSPIYYYTWTSLIKAPLDRLYAKISQITDTKFYLLSACAAGSEEFTDTMVDCFHKYIGCYRAGGNSEGGYLFGLGAVASGDVRQTDYLDKAFEMGKSI